MHHPDLQLSIKDHISPLNFVLRPEHLISDVMLFLQVNNLKSKIFYFYVVDDINRLVGVVSSKKLLFSGQDEMIGAIMEKEIVSISEEAKLEHALEAFSQHQYLALPVVSKDKILKGVMDVRTALGKDADVLSEERRQDIFQIVGLHLEIGKKRSVFRGYISRMPWIFCNLFAGFACAAISEIYQLVISKFLVLAMFIPLVLSLSESVSMQSMMQFLQMIRKTTPPIKKLLYVLGKEIMTVTLISLSCGVIVGSMAPMWGEGLASSLIIGCGIFISIILSSVFGAFIPVFLHKCRLDPKLASGPIVLTIADIGTTAIYLTLATTWLV